ncbi:MAG: hypothetical protein IT168_32925 [Bryobacterales bacterium]|nr:hypothetical protein [Bryobacterales bacterium]
MPAAARAQLLAATAKVEITDRNSGPVNDPAWTKALVLKHGDTVAVIVTVDAVAIGEIGKIPNSYLASVRSQLQRDLGIEPKNVFVNASHCHHVVRTDSDRMTVQAVKEAWKRLEPVKVGAGHGFENRIQENRRMWLKDGTQADVRRAYSMPRDEDVVSTGPIDPEIGILRIDRTDGRPLAVLYNFAAHPIHGVPSGGNTADYPAFASKAIEENTGGDAMAFFIQGCAGDINPSKYKDVHQPHDAEPLGNLLGLSVLRAWRKIETKDTGTLSVVNETLALPRSPDFAQRMSAIEAEQKKLLKQMQGTSLNFKTFLPLYVQYKVTGEYPSYYSHRYMHEKAIGREALKKLDEENRVNMDQYLRNINIMEQLTRLQTNWDLLKKHQAEMMAGGSKTIDAEVAGLRVGDFRLITFPGELTVEIGLGLKKGAKQPNTFVAGYTNGYLYYTATTKQRSNTGYAQEDCDARVAPEWQKIFESKAVSVLNRLER